MPNVWAGVVRVSFVGGRGGDSFHSDSDQISDLEAGVARMGGGATLELLPAELNVSGGLPLERRPSLLAAIEGVERGDYAGIIVSYLSRLGRNLREQLKAWDRVEAAGGRIVVVREGIDTSTASGRMHRNLLLSIAEGEREQHAERFAERRRLATEAGIWQRRQTPRGYRRDPTTRRLVPDERADEVRRAFRHRGGGGSLNQVADHLQMTPSGARSLLANRVYLGELRVGRPPHPVYINRDAHPPLVTVEEWEVAQVFIPRPGRGPGGVPALLTGIVRCQGCGYAMARGSGGAKRVAVYSCRGRNGTGRCAAPASITGALVDAYVTTIARRRLAELAVEVVEGPGDDVEAARRAADDADNELATYLRAVSAADVGESAFRDGARARRDAVEATRLDYQRVRALRPVAPAYADGADAWNSLSGHGHNAILRALFEMVIVKRAGGRGATTPVGERIRVVRHGAGLLPNPPAPLPFPDLDQPGVIGLLGG